MATAEADPHPLGPFPGTSADPTDDPRPATSSHPAAGGRAGAAAAVPPADPSPTGVPGAGPGGAWTEERYLALPAADRIERRVELLDGSLLVAPGTDERHARAVDAVRAAVAAVLPDGLEVTGPVALRLAPGRILVPDLVVAARETAPDAADGSAGADGAAGEGAVRDSAVALVVVDVVGRANGVADRWFKPQLYAGSRIPYALLVDHDGPFAVGSMLIGGRYHEYAHAGAGEVLRLEEPFVLELDLADLAPADTGPDGAAEDSGPAGAVEDTGPGPDAADGTGPTGSGDDRGPAEDDPSARPPT